MEDKFLPEISAQHSLVRRWFLLFGRFFSSRSQVLYPYRNFDNQSLPTLADLPSHQADQTLAESPNFQTIVFLFKVFQSFEVRISRLVLLSR